MRYRANQEHIYPICVLRDPFNLLASKLRWSHGKKYAPSINEVFEAKNQWLEYARLYLQQQNDSRIIWVNFNSWFASERMREHYADRLNLDCSHRGLNIVAKYGPATWGDSFDELSFDEHAQQMKVFERWKNYRSNETFRTLVKDSELITLSKKIYDGFPDISEAINFAADL